MTTPKKLPLKQLICYSIGNVTPTAIYGFLGAFILKYYTDYGKLDPAWVGWALFAKSIIDIAIDPAIGYWSDRTPVSIGRRRPYFLFGALPAALFFYLTMIIPNGSGMVNFLYLVVMSSLTVCFLSVMGIPHLAMGFEMTTDYNERISIFGYKNFIENLTILVATFSVPVAMQLSETSWLGHVISRGDCYCIAAAAMSVLAIVAALVAYFGTEERPAELQNYRFVDGLIGVFRNKAFLVLSLVFLLIAIADRLITAELFIVIEHFHGMKEEDSLSLLVGFFVGGIVSVWPWVWLAQRFGKDVVLRLAIALWPLTCIAFVLRQWTDWQICVVAMAMGIAGTGMITIIGSLVPDVLDYESAGAPQRREGMYVSMGNLIYQVSVGIGFLIAGLTLHLIGYEGTARPTAELVWRLRVTFAAIPALLALSALVTLSYFPVRNYSYGVRGDVCGNLADLG